MPAIPMAESKPPIVVGISVTNSATSVVTEICAPDHDPIPTIVTTAIKKISVKPASRTSSAISLGVF